MFERYTVKARRTIFFSRHEAIQSGSAYIETQHLLLGLLHEDAPLAQRLMGSQIESIRTQVDQHTRKRQPISTAIDLPLSDEGRRALGYAVEEADRMAHQHIGTEHLLLGLLREKKTLAAKLLSQQGLRTDDVRSALIEQPHESASDIPATTREVRMVGGIWSQSRQDELIRFKKPALLRSIRIWLAIVIVGLFLSGVTAFPLQHELALTLRLAAHLHLAEHAPGLNTWFQRVYSALADTNARYPFLAYGTDWLAFAHLVIAAAFIGPYLDPVRNKWFITWGFIACGGVPLLAFIAGPIRGIPFYWRVIDSSFGIFCCLCLLIIRRNVQRLEALQL